MEEIYLDLQKIHFGSCSLESFMSVDNVNDVFPETFESVFQQIAFLDVQPLGLSGKVCCSNVLVLILFSYP